ncbi:hypothetical protein K2173_002613 [Erythroxylum novogranatense]|uniref:DNA 3'-5' helicase n=1 Tax=Erythroxylum novogranatense TaxID=1862640 RepID=A0AAV8SY33_9ROSI|nr:hypothetical protein K2173_002613 [Erythroxylum novogranatense]
MDSDSDSGGSHISATPPRNSSPVSPSAPPLPRPVLSPKSLISSHKSATRSAKTSSLSKPKKPPREVTKPPSDRIEDDFSDKFGPPSALPFQICRPSSPNHQGLTLNSIDTLPAGYFAKSTSFSKLQRASLSFESSEASSAATVLPKVDNLCVTKKKHLNLIRANEPLPPAKLRKNIGSEGNFVKMNLNRNKKRFTNRKGQKSRFNYRRSKRRVKSKGEGEVEMEEGFVVEGTQEKKPRKNNHSIEEAVSAAKYDPSDENLVRLLNEMFGYESFRDGQLETIKMVLDGKSTMLVLPTGAGKTMCYQIPAVLLRGITVVVSPLLALMIDQLKQLPSAIPGSVLCSSQTPQEAAQTLRLVQDGVIKVLFVSPERFLNEDFLSIFSAEFSVSLLVVDEAHCVSEWSHNFRPSYMRLRASLLRARLHVGCILAMTATVTTSTLNAVMSALEIPSTNLIQKSILRDNLLLSVSLSGNRMKALLKLIKSSPFTELHSIIIYCKFQSETDIISRYLCDNNISAKSYHSAIPSRERCHIQELFCSNKIKVVVATVAFGMGLDKRDVGAVIHYSLPESLEEYVQEIGRAGRDGRMSYCHLFFDDVTYFKLQVLCTGDFIEGVDEYAINKFLCQVFASDVNSQEKIHSIIKESASRRYDMKEEVMLTLLTQLELGEVQYLRLLPQLNVTCSLNFYKTSPLLLAEKDIVVSAILKKSEAKQGQYVFDISVVANSLGITPLDLSNHLQNLKLKGEITYEVKDPAFCYSIVKIPEDFCSLSTHLTKWLLQVERSKVQKLDAMFNAVTTAVKESGKPQGFHSPQQMLCLQREILGYFKGDGLHHVPSKTNQSSPFLRADIKVFLQSNSQAKFTPRAIARIMHGIGSPAYPSATWAKTHFWGRYTHVDFQAIMEAAKAELMNFVGKDIG